MVAHPARCHAEIIDGARDDCTVQLGTDATAVGNSHSSLGAQVPLLSTQGAPFGGIVALACTVLSCLASTLGPLRERDEMKEARG
jgi:hypothetical protein